MIIYKNIIANSNTTIGDVSKLRYELSTISGFISSEVSGLSGNLSSISSNIISQINTIKSDVKGGINYKGHVKLFNKHSSSETLPLSILLGNFYHKQLGNILNIDPTEKDAEITFNRSIELNNGWLYYIDISSSVSPDQKYIVKMIQILN